MTDSKFKIQKGATLKIQKLSAISFQWSKGSPATGAGRIE
jgi:hypothetical protein